MPLDSDVDNADAQLHVEFYEYNNTSKKDDQWNGQPFIRIMTPGDKTNIIEAPVREHHKARFPRQWLYWQMRNANDPGIGTTIAQWRAERPDEISEYQEVEFKMLKFNSVEQIATASDAQLQRVGMGAVAARLMAQNYLKRKNVKAGTEQSDELVKARSEIEEIKAQLAELLATKQSPAPVITVESIPRAPRKAKAAKAKRTYVRKAGNVEHDAATGDAGHG